MMMLPDPETLHQLGKIADHALAAVVIFLHRKSLGPAIARLTERVRQLELAVFGTAKAAPEAAPEAKP